MRAVPQGQCLLLPALHGVQITLLQGDQCHQPPWKIAGHLAQPAVAVLHQAAARRPAEAADDCLVFGGRSGSAPIGEGSIGDLYRRAGFSGRHVPHGWRASFSTIMNEALGDEWARTIDRALAHTPKDKVEAAYNRAQQLQRRRELYCRWAELLTA